MDSLVERQADTRGYIVGNGDRTKWRAWIDGLPVWVDDPAEATRYGFRSDANAVHAEDEDAWCVVKYEDVATPSARITGDKDRENPVEGAPYGEGLIGRIDALEVKESELRRALAYAQEKQISLMQERTYLKARIAEQDRLLKLAREALRPLAERQTIAEMLADPAPSGWVGLSPDERIADVVARKEKHDRDTMQARQALAAMEQANAD